MQENERPRKYYTLLPEGKKQFEHNMHEWELVHSLFGKILNLST
jgi:DNA-binding PadR family transcriptional regulator